MTSTTLPVLQWAAILLWFGVAISREAVLPRTLVNRRINIALACEGMVATLRTPQVQQALAPHLDNITVIRIVTHGFAMAAAVAVFGIARSWTGREKARHLQTWWYIGVAALVIAMFRFAAPSMAAGETIEEYGTWRAFAYHLCYAIPIVVAFGSVFVLYVLEWHRQVSRRTRVATVLIFLMCGISVFDNAFRVFASVYSSMGISNNFTDARIHSNDLFFLPTVTVLALLFAYPVLSTIAARMSGDSDVANLRRLRPMWRTLTAAVPEVVLDEGRSRADSYDLHRMVVEIQDANLILSRYRKLIDPESVTTTLNSLGVPHEQRDAVCANLSTLLAADARAADPNATSHGTAACAQAANGPLNFATEIHTLIELTDSWPIAVRAHQLIRTPDSGASGS